MPTRNDVEISFPVDHPAAAGHFPGNPIVPGALLLDRALRAIGLTAPVEIRHAKFLRPVRPGDKVILHWKSTPNGGVDFECRLNDEDGPALIGQAGVRR